MLPVVEENDKTAISSITYTTIRSPSYQRYLRNKNGNDAAWSPAEASLNNIAGVLTNCCHEMSRWKSGYENFTTCLLREDFLSWNNTV